MAQAIELHGIVGCQLNNQLANIDRRSHGQMRDIIRYIHAASPTKRASSNPSS